MNEITELECTPFSKWKETFNEVTLIEINVKSVVVQTKKIKIQHTGTGWGACGLA